MIRKHEIGYLKQRPLKDLKQLAANVQSIIKELEGAMVRREIDIAAEHNGEENLIHSVLQTFGDKTTGRWRQVELIYCCLDRCPRCPHGEFVFGYRRSKRKKTLTVTFAGEPALDNETLKWMMDSMGPIGKPYNYSLVGDDEQSSRTLSKKQVTKKPEVLP